MIKEERHGTMTGFVQTEKGETMDKLISLERTKKEIRNYIEEESMLTLLDCVLDKVPSVDPMAKGQWMRYDQFIKIIRAQRFDLMTRENEAGADALEELAKYFEMLSNICPREDFDD